MLIHSFFLQTTCVRLCLYVIVYWLYMHTLSISYRCSRSCHVFTPSELLYVCNWISWTGEKVNTKWIMYQLHGSPKLTKRMIRSMKQIFLPLLIPDEFLCFQFLLLAFYNDYGGTLAICNRYEILYRSRWSGEDVTYSDFNLNLDL